MKLEELVGKPITEAQFDEAAGKKDACYHKVKARYDVWPSAYASGALVKCRKVGAANWGKSKKEGVNEMDSPMFKITYKDSRGAKKTDIMRAKNSNLAKRDFNALHQGRGFKILKVVKEGVNEDVYYGYYKDKKVKVNAKSDKDAKKQIISKLKIPKRDLNISSMINHTKNKQYKHKFESVNEASMELKKLEDAIKMFQKKIKKQGSVTNARDEDHLKNLIKVYKQMGGKGVKEGLGDRMAKKLKKHKGVNLKKKKVKRLKLKGRGVYQDYDGLDDSIHFESITENGMTTNHIYYEEDGKGYGYTLEFVNDLNEAEYQGRKVKLGKIMQGDAKKFKVYVKNPKGNVVKVNFGQGGDAKGGTMKIRKSNPAARKSFRARHNCDNPGPRHKARYWSCRKW